MALQFDPAVITSTDLITLHNQHTLAEQHSVPGALPEEYSTYTIPASGIVSLRELPKKQQNSVPTGVSVVQVPGGPFLEVLNTPGASQFQVNYTNGNVTFNVVDAGKNVLISYTALGSVVKAEHVNNISRPFVPFYNKLDGIVPDGGVDFTFPNDVTINGDLNVIGVVNRLASEVINITDSLILLNQVHDGPVLNVAGVEISRSGSAQGNPLNSQLVWHEPSLSWNFYSTSGGPTGSVGYPLLTVFDVGGITGTKLTSLQEAALVGTLVLGDMGRQWFNTDERQFKGWNGNEVVILG